MKAGKGSHTHPQASPLPGNLGSDYHYPLRLPDTPRISIMFPLRVSRTPLALMLPSFPILRQHHQQELAKVSVSGDEDEEF